LFEVRVEAALRVFWRLERVVEIWEGGWERESRVVSALG
jgi:hypothetical protein